MKFNLAKVATLSVESNVRLLVNNRYCCEFKAQNGRIFSSWNKEELCPRHICEAEAFIYDIKHFSKRDGQMTIAIDSDTGCCTGSLYMKDDDHQMLVNITNVEVKDARQPVTEFMKLMTKDNIKSLTDNDQP